jgi:uncharacterized membrane protein YkoI
MTRKRFISCLIAVLIALTSTGMVEARRDDRRDDKREDRREDRRDDRTGHSTRQDSRREGISLDEAVARIRRETGGRVLSAEARDRRGDATYRIKVLLPNGAVRVYNVDARSGRMD